MLQEWGISSLSEYIGILKLKMINKASPNFWSHPSSATVKLNFDGASNGNPGVDGFGGAVKNHHGKIQGVFWGSLGYSTNNTTELDGLLIGVSWDIKHKLTPLIVEGDSLFIINMANKITEGFKNK